MDLRKYRRKPTEIEAVRVTEPYLNQIAEWCGGHSIIAGVEIPTLEGNMVARIGDYVVCGTHGEFYPVKPEIFASIYELIGEFTLPVNVGGLIMGNMDAAEVRRERQQNSVMLYVGGGKTAFRCGCGANVFYKGTDDQGEVYFECNGCHNWYRGEK